MYIIVHFCSQEESQGDYFDEDCQEGLLNEVRKDISRDPSADQTAELREGEHHKNSYRTSKPPSQAFSILNVSLSLSFYQ